MKNTTFSIKIFFCFCVVILFSVLVPCGYFLHSIKEESIDLTREEAFREVSFVQTCILDEVKKAGGSPKSILPEMLRRFIPAGNTA